MSTFFDTIRLPPFSALWDFFWKFFDVSRVSLLAFLDNLLATDWILKPPGCPPFKFLGTETVQISNFSRNFFNASKAPQFLSFFATEWSFKKPKGSPFYDFKNFALLDIAPTLAVPGLLIISQMKYLSYWELTCVGSFRFLKQILKWIVI